MAGCLVLPVPGPISSNDRGKNVCLGCEQYHCVPVVSVCLSRPASDPSRRKRSFSQYSKAMCSL